MSKRATECVIQGGEQGVGKQLALDSMKAAAIHSLDSLLDRNIIRNIITECGCRRGTKRSQRPIVTAVLPLFLSAEFQASVYVMISAWKFGVNKEMMNGEITG